MRILILTNNDMGLYKFRREMIQVFLEKHEVYIALPKGDFIDCMRELGCKFVDIEIERRGTNLLQDVKLLKAYFQTIDVVSPDIIFTYTVKPNIYGGIVASYRKVPYVVNITGLGTALENKGFLQIVIKSLYRFALINVQTVFFQNKENEIFFTRNKLALGKHKMLPGSGVNLEYYKVTEYPNSETINFLFVARIMKEKGIDQYLEAAKFIHTRYPFTSFHICGFCEEAYEKKIEELALKGVVIYHGLVKDMRHMYKMIHCTVHPTYYPEGLSNVLLESAASGRPIITTDRPGCREVIDEGITGFLVKEKDSMDLIKKMIMFIGLSFDEKRRMGLAGRKKIEKEFDRKIVIKKYVEELPSVIG